VNAYERKAGIAYLQVKLGSMPEHFQIYIVYKIAKFLSFMYSGCLSVCPSVHLFIWTDLVTMVSHQRLEEIFIIQQ